MNVLRLLSVILTAVPVLTVIDQDGGLRPRSPRQPFLWGVATAAYQIEGSTNIDGRGPSIWDTFAHITGNIANGDNGDVADDSYNLIDVDVALVKALGLNSYRFSISWTRILPQGTLEGGINYLGIRHYNKLIDLLIDADITPLVTLYHWDLPQALEDKYEGWLSGPEIERDFKDFADLCFSNFGDRVKMWITINEPWTYSLMGYGLGTFAPGRCSDRSKCSRGNSSTEPYIVAHNSLNAHAAVVELYRFKYQALQQGLIGITLNHDWAEPLTNSTADYAAAERRNEFAMGWFGDPLVFGRYPDSMARLVGDRLPRFSRLQKSRLLGSFDFLGLNHYSSKFYSENHEVDSIPSWGSDQQNIESKYSQSGQIIGPQAASSWLNLVPWGFYKVLMWSSRRYTRSGQPPPLIYVTENGCDAPGESLKQLPEVLHDSFRVDYLRQYLEQLDRAVHDGAHIRGYFAWSLLDNFEWADGFNYRFGLHYVDYTSPQHTRTPKDSAMWFSSHVRNHTSSHSYYNTKGANNKFLRSWIGLLSAALHNSDNGWLVSQA